MSRAKPMTNEALQAAVAEYTGNYVEITYSTKGVGTSKESGRLSVENGQAFIKSTDRHGNEVNNNILRQGSDIIFFKRIGTPPVGGGAAAAAILGVDENVDAGQQQRQILFNLATTHASEAAAQRATLLSENRAAAEVAHNERVALQQQGARGESERAQLATMIRQLGDSVAGLDRRVQAIQQGIPAAQVPMMQAAAAAAIPQQQQNFGEGGLAPAGANGAPLSATRLIQTPALWAELDPMALKLGLMERYGALNKVGSNDFSSVVARTVLVALEAWSDNPRSLVIPNALIGLLERQLVYSVNPAAVTAFTATVSATEMAPQFAKGWAEVKDQPQRQQRVFRRFQRGGGGGAQAPHFTGAARPAQTGDGQMVPRALWDKLDPATRAAIQQARKK